MLLQHTAIANVLIFQLSLDKLTDGQNWLLNSFTHGSMR